MGMVGNMCMILKNEGIIKFLSTQNQLQLTICGPLKNIGYMNENHNNILWIKTMIVVEPTLLSAHIDHSHQMLMMN